MPRRARSRSALGATMAALLPPSSSRARPKRAAISGAICRPIRTEPVAETSATRGSSTSAWPTSRPPSTSWWMPGRSADVGDGPGQQGVGGQRAQRGGLGRLPDHGVAGDQRQGGVPGVDRDREVEGGDDADHAERVPGLGQPVAGALGGDGLAEQLAGLADGQVADVDHLLDLAERLGGDLADLGGDQGGQVGLVLGQQLTPALDQLAADRGRHVAPGGEGLGGRGDGRVDLGRRSASPRRRSPRR